MKVLGSMSIQQFIFEDLGEIVLPADILVDSANSDVEVPKDPRFQIAKRMEIFVGRSGQVGISAPRSLSELIGLQSYLDIIRAISMNRSRMRRMLCHIIVDWDNLQLDVRCVTSTG